MLSRTSLTPEFIQCVNRLLSQIIAKTQYGFSEEIDAILIQLKFGDFFTHLTPFSTQFTSKPPVKAVMHLSSVITIQGNVLRATIKLAH